jgi:hypothetical protein
MHDATPSRPRWLLLDSETHHRTLDLLSLEACAAYVHCCTWAAHYGIEDFGWRACDLFTRRRWSIKRELIAAGLWIVEGDNIRIGHPDGDPIIKRFPTNGGQRARRPIPPGVRYSVLERDNFTCQSCGATPTKDDATLHVDHKIAVSKGGTNELENLQTLCSDCNIGKAAR